MEKKMMINRNISGRLSSMNLSNCNISDINNLLTEGLLQLDSLDLSYNQLTRVPYLMFSYMPNLVSLSLKGNPISTVMW